MTSKNKLVVTDPERATPIINPQLIQQYKILLILSRNYKYYQVSLKILIVLLINNRSKLDLIISSYEVISVMPISLYLSSDAIILNRVTINGENHSSS